jgi:8-oxo-dGTP diphosphatase
MDRTVVLMNWNDWKPAMRATLMFIVDESAESVLLIRKKRGLGAGKINGPGGKRDPGESSLQCAVRETQEELGVTALDPVKHGELWFAFVDGLQMHVDVYLATRYEGQAVETDEAVPLWTPLTKLPFDEMWADDAYWLRELLVERRIFTGKFAFDGDKMIDAELKWASGEWEEK